MYIYTCLCYTLYDILSGNVTGLSRELLSNVMPSLLQHRDEDRAVGTLIMFPVCAMYTCCSMCNPDSYLAPFI